MEKARFGRGGALLYIRKEYKNWDQNELAAEAIKLWTSHLKRQHHEGIDPDHHVGMPNKKDTLRVAISKFETTDKLLTKDQSQFVCAALGIPAQMLELRFIDKNAFEEYFEKWLGHLSDAQKPTGKDSLTLSRPRFDVEDLKSTKENMSFLQRRSISQLLDQEVVISSLPSIIHLFGKTGSGKSTFLSHWFESVKSKSRDRDVLAINMENRTGDDLFERLTRYCVSVKLEKTRKPHEDFFSLRRPVLILDSLDRFNSSETIGSPLSQTIAIQNIIEFVTNNDLDAKIILITASDLFQSHLAIIDAAKSTAGENWREIEVSSLGETDATRYLAKRGIGQSDEERNSIHTYFGGNGTLISAYANLSSRSPFSIVGKETEPTLIGTPDVETRILALSKLFNELALNEPMTYFVCCLLAYCHEAIANDDLKQTAELMLSAGLPIGDFGNSVRVGHSSTTGVRLREALRSCFSGEISNFIRSSSHTSHIQREIGRSIRPANDLAFHYLAKEAFIRSADHILGKENFALAHYTLACVLARKTPSSSSPAYLPQLKHIEAFHSIIFHLNHLFEVKAEIASSNCAKLTEIIPLNIGQVEDKLLFDEIANGRLSLAQLELDSEKFLQSLYILVMKKTLGLEQNPTTRQLGSFERKLSMLSNFLQLESFNNDGVVRVRPELKEWSAEILRDIVVCANHTGKIQLAHGAARALLLAIGEDRPLFAKAIEMLRNPAFETDKDAIRHLNKKIDNYSGYIAASATSYMREGEILIASNLVLSAIGTDVQNISVTAIDSVDVLDRSRRGIRIAVRRLVAKLAQLNAISGKVDQAAALFAKAKEIEILNGNMETPLRGESGRAYVRLLSSYFDIQSFKNEIITTINNNINYGMGKSRFHEVVEWKVEEAWFFYKCSKMDKAIDILSEIAAVSSVHSLQVSYGTLREIELLRMVIKSDEKPKKFESSYIELCLSLENTRHVLLFLDALSLADKFLKKELDIEIYRKKACALIFSNGVNSRWLRGNLTADCPSSEKM